MTTGRLAPSLVELVGVCARQQAINLDLFESLGALATSPDTTPGPDQQLFARSSHRHAWHAELWAQRAPLIPAQAPPFDGPVDGDEATSTEINDAATYRAVVRALVDELTHLRRRVDALLDPSTDRVIELVLSDLAQSSRAEPTGSA